MTQKTKVAFFDFTGCEGCQLTVIDSLQTHLELLEAIEIVQFREAMTEADEDYQIAFIEGSYSRPRDEQRLRKIREQADIVVALGACAHLGGVNSIKNIQASQQNVREYVYGEQWDWYDTKLVQPISAIITVDAIIPGCPIDRLEFLEVVKNLLIGKTPSIPDYPVCVECKLKENVCILEQGGTCLGPITSAGCQAICPSYGTGCDGCRGFIPNPNRIAMKDVLFKAGMTVEQLKAKISLFNASDLPNWKIRHG